MSRFTEHLDLHRAHMALVAQFLSQTKQTALAERKTDHHANAVPPIAHEAGVRP